MNTQQPQEQWVTLGEAAKMAQVSGPKLKRMIQAHNIPTREYERDRRKRFVDVNVILRLLEGEITNE